MLYLPSLCCISLKELKGTLFHELKEPEGTWRNGIQILKEPEGTLKSRGKSVWRSLKEVKGKSLKNMRSEIYLLKEQTELEGTCSFKAQNVPSTNKCSFKVHIFLQVFAWRNIWNVEGEWRNATRVLCCFVSINIYSIPYILFSTCYYIEYIEHHSHICLHCIWYY